MKHNQRAFTLIELLVVVLIIGILAAVALPQYQFAVDKSRVAPYIQHAQNIIKAENIYFLANGTYTTDLEELDIDLTKICPILNTAHNEIYNCPGGFGFNIRLNDPSTLDLMYCAEQSNSTCNSGRGTKHMWLVFSVRSGEIKDCYSYDSTRGKRLCAYFKPN